MPLATLEAPAVEQKKSPKNDRLGGEEVLMECVRAGDRAAFEKLIRAYEQEMIAFLRHKLGNLTDAEDAFQHTWLNIWLKADTFKKGNRFRSWAYTVATNQAIDCMRKKMGANGKRRMASIDRVRSRDDEDDLTMEDIIEGTSTSVSEPLERQDDALRIRAVIDRLPALQKDVVDLVYYQGKKYRQAAEELGIPLGTVKSRLHAAMKAIRDELMKIGVAA